MATPNKDYDAVRKDIAKVIPRPDYDDGSAGPVLVRLAWHASGTYDEKTKTGGSNGAGMRYECEGGDPANAGLQHARVFLEPVKEKYPWISYADLWTLAGVVAIKEMGGPDIPWKAGRTDFTDDSKCPPRGRLPDAALASDHLRDVFYRMGFNDQEIVCLSGAHSLGRCHSDRSGFEGPWSMSPTKFSTQYYRMLTKFKWEKKDWTGPFQYKNEDLGEELMMLPTDLALIEDPKFKPWVEKYAADRDLFFSDFSKAFAKLIELGVDRSEPVSVNSYSVVVRQRSSICADDPMIIPQQYKPAPKKSDELGAPEHGDGLGHKGVGKAKL
ncbi:BZ3500_MvSof-1268-A1-R1_Chr3-3g06436 [Microbotryum saponariae]|uniref:Peroxidase n=1 Tax=Microbotryum saponariae TaxID=289078 RepID=A0A2X0KUN9_9BASI|nr:BZ3500_MvSof-1268-A1-R1_Chr3-3g06436 [Microbotryum saponariae]SDA04403.1 BZ3501_MvSof-1269-A2-R1_Chr3-2g06123 [Microbotryum saponariae]